MARDQTFTTIKSEGGLLPTDLLAKVRESGSGLPGTSPDAYHLAPSERLNEAITRSWNRLTGAWKAFEPERTKAASNNVATGATRQNWLLPLFQELGYGQLATTKSITIGEKEYPISHLWGAVPIHLVGVGVGLDRRSAGVRGAAAMSPHGMEQELLNRSEDHLWGIVSNGLVLRVLRDNASLTRPAYLQFDLEAMFDGDVFADFVVLWLACHASRLEGDIPAKCLLEEWAHEAVQRGTRALDQLRVGVEEAIAALGEGFLAHPSNADLRAQLENGSFDKQEYYRELLRLVYRLLFLLVTEARDLLLQPHADETTRARYRDHYGVERLRSTADQVRGGPHSDQWQGLQLVFAALGRLHGEEAIGLPGLGGFLWEQRATRHVGECRLANQYLFRALRALSMVQDGKVRRRVDYGDLDSQELGSVYESLLELHPVLDVRARTFSLSTAGGNERKTTGAYYTPDELVEELLDSALNPVLDEAGSADDPEKALLAVTVLDPACGSGHFLIAAGRRIANRLARVRAQVGEPSPAELTTAMRDVVGQCLHGIDVQEMAVELCKVSLWMAAAEPGRPLSFLEHRIVHGNGLLGTTPRLIAEGIPDEAFKPLTGDDKEVVKAWKAINKRERANPDQLQISFSSPEQDLEKLTELTDALDALPDDDLTDMQRKQQAWSGIQHGFEMARAHFAADAWCTAFVAPKVTGAPVITSRVVAEAQRNLPSELDQGVVEAVSKVSKEFQFLHYHLAFPHVFRVPEAGDQPTNEAAGWSDGFTVVLGNPPWERVKLQEKEFFAARSADIVSASNAAERKRMIGSLLNDDPALHASYKSALRRAEGESHLLRSSGRFPLCGVGRDINTASVFAEAMRNSMNPIGLAGIIVPTSIATDDTTKAFFSDIIECESLVSLFDFDNARLLFGGIDRRSKFCLLTMGGTNRSCQGSTFSFFSHSASDLGDNQRTFTLSSRDFYLLNCNTRTCPIFRSSRDAGIVKAVYERIGSFVCEGQVDGNPWNVGTRPGLFHMGNDSGLFLKEWRETDVLPLYEGKMIWHYDHRWSNGDTGAPIHSDSTSVVIPNWYVERAAIAPRVGAKTDWFLGFRDVTNGTNERTLISAIIPFSGVGHNLTLFDATTRVSSSLVACLASICLDFVARCKTGGSHMSAYILRQLPLPHPDLFLKSVSWIGSGTLDEWISKRVLELTYTAWDLEGYAAGVGHFGAPFRWQEGRRSVLRCELDALFFHLYGIEMLDVDYIVDTFPIMKRKEESEVGEFRTKRLILEIYDEMAEAQRTGTEYQTRLDPPPADPSLCHPESTRPEWAVRRVSPSGG